MQPAASATSSRATCTLVVVTFNSASHLPRFLDSVPVALRDGHARVIVVDNGSTDGTVPLARAHPSVDLVEVGTNRGYAGGINVGRRHAAPRLPLVVANPDLRFHDLRHTGATMLAQEGATIAELMDRLGHTTPKAALVYQHVAEGRDRIIADRMALLAQPAAPGVDGD